MSQNGTVQANAASLEALMNGVEIFDDVLPEPIRVSIVDFRTTPTEEVDEQGQAITIRVPRTRVALINSYVPMKVLHSMMASQEKLRRVQAMAQEGNVTTENQQMMLAWMTDQVLAVWRLTEPNMTAEKLAEGLSYQKIFGLFGRFFGDLLKQLNAQQ